MLSLLHVNANLCVCVHSCLFSFAASVRPVWRSGTVTAWWWWTTCRKPFFCACRHWICMEPLILTSASLVRLAEIDNPRQVTHTDTQTQTHTHTSSILPLNTNTVIVALHHKAYSYCHFLSLLSSKSSLFTLLSSVFCLLLSGLSSQIGLISLVCCIF